MKSARKISNFSKCARCHQSLIEINHYGERPIAFCDVQVWQASTSKCCRLAPEDIMALRSIKPRLVTAQTGKESPAIMFSAVYCAMIAKRRTRLFAASTPSSATEYKCNIGFPSDH
jgi:hypothetical protein